MDFSSRIRKLLPSYEEAFAERGDGTPSEPLQFHLYHLALYWSRLVGFCRHSTHSPEVYIDSELGACVAMGAEFVNSTMEPGSPHGSAWRRCWDLTQAVLYERPVTLQDVEAASASFDKVLAVLKFDPWKCYRAG